MQNKNIIEKTIKESSVSVPENASIRYSALTLAYLGDCVYELYVRSYLTADGNHKVRDLHKAATKYVCAKAQAEFYHKIKDILTDEELSAYRRGRNAKSHPPKNADVLDYKIATGIEAMFGHMYINGNTSRISELMSYLFE